jgi:hypothetical protein
VVGQGRTRTEQRAIQIGDEQRASGHAIAGGIIRALYRISARAICALPRRSGLERTSAAVPGCAPIADDVDVAPCRPCVRIALIIIDQVSSPRPSISRACAARRRIP